jgi:hypothetical protein
MQQQQLDGGAIRRKSKLERQAVGTQPDEIEAHIAVATPQKFRFLLAQ